MNSRYDIYAEIIIEAKSGTLTQLILCKVLQNIVICQIHLFNFLSYVFALFTVFGTPKIRVLSKNLVDNVCLFTASLRDLA